MRINIAGANATTATLRSTFVFATGVIVLVAGAWAGCARDADREPPLQAAPRVVPVSPRDLAEWWTSGAMLLHLRRDGNYELYEGVNRFEPPIERGRWSQRNYVALDFDPYGRFNEPAERVQIDRDSEGGLVLILRDELPFVPLRRPPEVLEDLLTGEWRTDEFTLSLTDSLRYRLRRSAPADGGASGGERSAISGHQGAWRLLDHERLILEPEAPQIKPLTLRLIYSDDGVSIEDATRIVPE